MMRNRQKERSQNFFGTDEPTSSLTHVNISSSNEKNIQFIIRETQISFFCSIILAQIFPYRETTSVSNATSCDVRVNTLERKSTVQTRVNKKCVVKNEKNQILFFLCATKQQKHKKREEESKQTKTKKNCKKDRRETTTLDKKH